MLSQCRRVCRGASSGGEAADPSASADAGEEAEDQEPEEGATLFVKNINFETTDAALREVSGVTLCSGCAVHTHYTGRDGMMAVSIPTLYRLIILGFDVL